MGTPVFNVRYLLTNSVSSPFVGADYRLSGVVFDESANFTNADISVDDEFVDFSGSRYRVVNIFSLNNPSSGYAVLDVADYRGDGAVTLGNGLIATPSDHFDFMIPTREANQLSEYVKTFTEHQAVQEIDQTIYDTSYFTEEFTIDATILGNKYVDLLASPEVNKPITFHVISGPAQLYGTDFTVINGNRVSWNGYDLETIFSIGDSFIVGYYIRNFY
jgi:hypothetical protein